MNNRISPSVASRAFVSAVLVISLFATACGSGSDSTTDAAGSNGAAPTTASNNDASSNDQLVIDPFAVLAAGATFYDEASVGDAKVGIAVLCVKDVSTPTAIVQSRASGLPAGVYEAVVTPSIGTKPQFNVQDVAVQDLPAGGGFSALQTRFDEAEYVFEFAELGVSLTLPGCS